MLAHYQENPCSGDLGGAPAWVCGYVQEEQGATLGLIGQDSLCWDTFFMIPKSV